MKHMACGKVAWLGVFVLAGCYSYASEAINNASYNTVQASPDFAIIKVGDSDQVLVRLVNAANNGAVTSYTISGVGAGILVHYQAGFRPIIPPGGDSLANTTDKDAQQYYVLGVAPGQYTFTITPTSVNTGVSKTVTVVVTAITLGPALSKTAAVAGDTVVLTAPTGSVFSPTSAVTFTTGQVAIVSRSATSITFIAGPGITGPATVTKVGLAANAAVPAVTLVTTNTLTTPAVTVAPTTVSSTTPLLGASITVTLGGSLRFTPASTIQIGGNDVIIISRSADSSTATVVPTISGGAIESGLISYTGIVLGFLNTVPLSIPGDKSITVNTSASDPNAGTIGTASTLALAASGQSVFLGDSGPFTNSAPCAVAFSADGCRWYKVVIAASTTIDLDARWQGGSDNGLYVLDVTGTTIVTSADGAGQGAGGQPETKTATLAPGTYFFGQVFFGENSGYPPSANTVPPAYYLWQITTH